MARMRFMQEPDYATLFPGDLSPDVAQPGTRIPYIVVTAAEGVVVYGLDGFESPQTETCTLLVVAHSRAEATACADWIRKMLRTSWKGVATDPGSDYTLMNWRVDSFSEGADVLVEGDDNLARTTSLVLSGAFRFRGDNQDNRFPEKNPADTTTEKDHHAHRI